MAWELLSDESMPEKPTSFKEDALSFGKEAGRQIGRTGLRAAETVAGFPGDVLSLVNEFISRPLVGGVTGKPTHPYEELGISKLLPTSEQLKKGHELQLGKAVKPQNKYEAFVDNLTTDATSIFLPGKKASGLLKGAGSALTKSLGANVAKEAVKDFTADEKKATYAHIGTLALLSFIDKPGAAKALSQGYKPLEEQVVKLAPVSATKLETNLSHLRDKMTKGTQAPSEKFVIDEVNAVLSKIKEGKITPEEAWASKRSLNEKLSKVLFDIPSKGSQQRARKLATQIGHELEGVLQLTSKENPKFYKELKQWNAAYKTMADSNWISNWIEKNVKYNPVSAGLLHMFGGPVGVSTVGTIGLPYQVGKIAYRMVKSPKLAGHYSRAMAAAALEDATTFNKQLRMLDQAIQKDEKSDRYSLIE